MLLRKTIEQNYTVIITHKYGTVKHVLLSARLM